MRDAATVADFVLPADFAEGTALDPVLARLKNAAPGAQAIPWSQVAKKLATRIAETLDVPIVGVIADAWAKAPDLGSVHRGAPGEPITTELGKHSLDLDYHPSFELVVSGASCPEIGLDIVLSLTLKGLIVKLQDGKLLGVTAGWASGRGTMACGDVTIVEKRTEEMALLRR